MGAPAWQHASCKAMAPAPDLPMILPFLLCTHRCRLFFFPVGLLGKDSLIQVADPQHRYLRGLLSPAFTPEAVAGYLPQIVDLMQRHLKEWADAGEEGVKGLDSFKLLTFEFIVQVRELGEGKGLLVCRQQLSRGCADRQSGEREGMGVRSSAQA